MTGSMRYTHPPMTSGMNDLKKANTRAWRRYAPAFVLALCVAMVGVGVWLFMITTRRRNGHDAVDPATMQNIRDGDHHRAVTAGIESGQFDRAFIMFHAAWCHNCHAAMRTFDELHASASASGDSKGTVFCTVDIDQCSEVTEAYGVDSVPFFVVLDKLHNTPTSATRLAQHPGQGGFKDQIRDILGCQESS